MILFIVLIVAATWMVDDDPDARIYVAALVAALVLNYIKKK